MEAVNIHISRNIERSIAIYAPQRPDGTRPSPTFSASPAKAGAQ